MVTKERDGHIVAVSYDDANSQYIVYIDDEKIGRAITIQGVNKIIDKHFAELQPIGQEINVLLDPGAIMPSRAHKYDAGLDLRSPVNCWIHPGENRMIDTGVHIGIPKNYVGLLTSKSSLMAKGITSRGTIDCGYTGSIRVVLYNHGDEGYQVNKGDKITQLVVLPCLLCTPKIVDVLGESERGDGGFGSTGK